ncbi:hypothetical protein EP7_001386 [Isosphaeraceae bacterium EP7]
MRLGIWRGVTLGLAMVGLAASSVMADGRLFHKTIPSLSPAIDVNTGGPYMAPPIPYGHYVGKDLSGKLGKHVGLLKGKFSGLGHAGHGGGDCADGNCGGHGGGGGHFGGHGGGGLGKGCGLFGGGCGLGHGGGGLGHGNAGCDSCGGLGSSYGVGKHGHHGGGVVIASNQSPAIIPSGQGVVASSQGYFGDPCSDPGCGLGHGGLLSKICGPCGGKGLGCGACGGKGLFSGDACGSCFGKGCGKCGGLGLFNKGGCGLCGGKGCKSCLGDKLGGLKAGLLGKLHHNKIQYFVGPGGPVPITPGYVPYINPVRSPRDFLSFPPYTP